MEKIAYFVFVVFFTQALVFYRAGNAGDPCALDDDNVHRLGKTRFYILHNAKNRKYQFSFDEAVKACESKGMRLAKVDKITTDAMISRFLEALLRKYKWHDTWYWIDAVFRKDINMYTPRDSRTPYNYTNFYFRQPRPTGVGGHVSWQNVYDKKQDIDQCIAITAPYPYPTDSYGFQTSWDERFCNHGGKRRALCEHMNPQCAYKTKNPEYFVDSNLIEKYFTEGNYIFANRRFIVSWKPRSKDDAQAYCAKHGLQLFVPGPGDTCLIPYLKLWAQPISTYQFWTPLTHKPGQGYYLNGTKVASTDLKFGLESRSSKHDSKFCTSVTWTYEYHNQTACPTCSWNGLTLTPSNCFNPIGTICQHANSRSKVCNWKSSYVNDQKLAVEESAVVTFGHDASKLWRSTYKQMFGNRVCGDVDRKMVSLPWKFTMSAADVKYSYDFDNTYWLVDENRFKDAGNTSAKCTVGMFKKQADKYVVETKKVSCTEWHFYLCHKNEAVSASGGSFGESIDKDDLSLRGRRSDDESSKNKKEEGQHENENDSDNSPFTVLSLTYDEDF